MFKNNYFLRLIHLLLCTSILISCTPPVPQTPLANPSTDNMTDTQQPDKLIYQSSVGRQTSHIYVMDEEGQNRLKLSGNADFDEQPDVSEDGQQIVFVNRLDDKQQLFVMDINGSNRTPVPNTLGAGFPIWGKGTKKFLVFYEPDGQPSRAIYRINRDGSERVQLTFPDANQTDDGFDVSADGEYVIFSRFDATQGGFDLYSKSIWNNDPPLQITHTKDQSEHLPVVSRDGTTLVYGVNDQIHIARLNGASAITPVNKIDLSAITQVVGTIDFSNNGERLIFDAGNPSSLYAVNLDGSQLQKLPNSGNWDKTPSVIPIITTSSIHSSDAMNTPNKLENSSSAPSPSQPSPFVTSEVLDAIHEVYLQGKTTEYRMSMFVLYQEMRMQDMTVISSRLLEMIDYASNRSIDGIEPLMITYLDAIALNGNREQKLAVTGKLFDVKLSFIYEMIHPYLELPMPISRYNTPFVLDMRGDVVRVLLQEFMPIVGDATSESGISTIVEVLNRIETRNKICEMASVKDSSGNLSLTEKLRDKLCKSTSETAKDSSGSGLAPLAIGQCFNPTLKESYSAHRWSQDFATCKQELHAAFGMKNDPVSRLMVEPITTGIVIGVVSAIATWAVTERRYDVEKELRESFKNVRDTMRIFEDKKSNLKDTQESFESAKSELEEAEGTDEEEAKKDAYEKADKELSDASTTANRARQDLNSAREHLADAEWDANFWSVDVDQVRNEYPDVQDIPEPQTQDTPACTRAVLGTDDPDILRHFSAIDDFAYVQAMKNREICTRQRSNPDSPDSCDYNPLDVMSLPICGLDTNTWSDPTAQACGLMLCGDGFAMVDDSCICTRKQDVDPRYLDVRRQACAAVRCPDDTSPVVQGMGCSCQGQTTGSPFPPLFSPEPPNPIEVEMFFAQGSLENSTIAEDDRVNAQIMYRVFLGKEEE